MGLITDKGCAKYAVLSDILGDEDHLGDMDFKVTGTRDGITATQMDIKVDGLSYEIMEQALEQAKRGRMHIMDIITETMPAPREDLKPHAPRIVTVTIDKDQIGALIGPGGKIIQDIQENQVLPSILKKLVIKVLSTFRLPIRNRSIRRWHGFGLSSLNRKLVRCTTVL